MNEIKRSGKRAERQEMMKRSDFLKKTRGYEPKQQGQEQENVSEQQQLKKGKCCVLSMAFR